MEFICFRKIGQREDCRPGPRVLGRWLCILMFVLCACTPQSGNVIAPVGDIQPPSIIGASQKGPRAFEICFDEDVTAVRDTYRFQPEPTIPEASAAGSVIEVSLSPAVKPGVDCTLSGEAQDLAGNVTRFLFSFAGYNETPAILRINELQCGKNTSASNPHRDYIELAVTVAGNLGGEMVEWANSVKTMEYKFPPAEVKTGDIILLHCAPEGLPGEKDETGKELGQSSGIDASNSARDFWTTAGGLPDETGIIALRTREGEPPCDGICYASQDKSGIIDSEKIMVLAKDLEKGGVWSFSDSPRWEESFLWKSSSSRPIHRNHEEQAGVGQWFVGDSGTQSPGLIEPAVPSSKSRSEKSRKKK